MEPPATEPSPPKTFAVDFNPYVGGDYNRDLAGQGTLTVRAEEPRFVFTGRSRGRLWIGKQPRELAFHSDQITNVLATGTGVRFTTPAGKSGAQRVPFVFTCASPWDAAAVAGLLPATRDTEFVARDTFGRQLAALPDASAGLGSITNLLILANAAVFVVMGLLGAGWFEVGEMMPYIRYGANNAAATTDGQWWRLVTCMFLHFGLVHLLMNMWALFQVGHFLERLLGRTLFTLVYFGSGIIGSFVTLWWRGDKGWSAGASGAVFGVYGALLGYLVRERQGVPRSVFQPMLKSTLLFAGYNLVYGAVHPNIDNAAHLGGLVGGFVLGWLCALPVEREARARLHAQRLGAGAVAVVAAIVIGVAIAPRYDYSVADELAWSDVNRPAIAREKAVLERQRQLVADFARSGDGAALARWLGAEAIPFYEEWRRGLAALKPRPEKSTAPRQAALLRTLDLKLEAYRRLERGARDADRTALGRFRDDERAVAAAIAEIPRAK